MSGGKGLHAGREADWERSGTFLKESTVGFGQETDTVWTRNIGTRNVVVWEYILPGSFRNVLALTEPLGLISDGQPTY